MKKTLLLLAVALLSSAAAFAQWTKPTIPVAAPAGQALVKDGATEQYLYNVEKKAFFTGGNDWQTRASVNDTLGAPVIIYDAGEGGPYRINNLVAKFNEWRDMFVDNKESIWVDNNNGANHDMWQFEDVDGTAFKIYNDGIGKDEASMVNPDNGYGYLSAPLDINDTRLYLTSWFLADATRGTEGSTWISVTPENYEAYVVALTAAYPEYENNMARYYAAVELKAVLDKAVAEQNGADLSAEIAVYNDNTSSLEALQAAIVSAKEKMAAWSASQASVENPQDVSTYIENGTFDVVGDFHGWSGDAFGAGGTTSTCAEHYNKNYNTYQDVNGGKAIANGIYKVSVYGFYRAGSLDNDYATLGKAEYRHAKLYAYTPQDTLYTGIPALSTWATEGNVIGGLQIGSTGLYVPNSMKEFTDWEDAGLGHQVDLIVPVLDGKLRIGAKKEVRIDTDWSIFDNFTLTYYGNGLDAYQMWRDQVLETILADMQTYDWANIYYERAAKAEFEAAVAAARAATEPQEIHDLTVGITAIVERVLNSIATYTELHDKWIQWEESISAYESDLVAEFLERKEEVQGILENGNLPTADVRALIEELQAQYDYAIKHSLKEGDDCTDMITNASFAQGLTGWTGEGTVTNNFFPNVERYENTVDISQTVTGVPAGLYSVSVKAFERPAANGSYTGEEESKVFLFMGDLQTPVQNICKDAVAPEDAQNEVNCYINDGQHADGEWPLDYNVEGYGYVPNSVTGASYAFKAGRYEQKVYGLVGDDGVMKIGLTSNGVKAHWVLWADFHLTFEGKNLEGLKEVLTPTIEGLDAWLEGQTDEMTLWGYNQAEARVLAVQDAFESEEATYDDIAALPTEIAAIKAYAEENKKLMAEWTAAFDALNEAFGEYSETAAEAVLTEAEEYIEEMEAASPAETDETTDEMAKEQIEKMKDLTARLAIPATDDASDDNPVDMTQVIVNPNFDDNNYNGWTLVKREGATGNYQTQNGFDGTKAMEFWSTAGATTKFDFYQDIAHLPAGTYELTVDAANSLNGQAAGTGEGAAYIYAANGADADHLKFHDDAPIEVQVAPCNGDGCDYHNYSVIFNIAENDIVRIGVMNVGELVARWVMVDNFALTYFGTNSAKTPSAGDVTIIEGVEAATSAPVVIYDLAGRRVAKAVKGIYIINGKKVVK